MEHKARVIKKKLVSHFTHTGSLRLVSQKFSMYDMQMNKICKRKKIQGLLRMRAVNKREYYYHTETYHSSLTDQLST